MCYSKGVRNCATVISASAKRYAEQLNDTAKQRKVKQWKGDPRVNYVFISPAYPVTCMYFCEALSELGVNVLGISAL